MFCNTFETFLRRRREKRLFEGGGERAGDTHTAAMFRVYSIFCFSFFLGGQAKGGGGDVSLIRFYTRFYTLLFGTPPPLFFLYEGRHSLASKLCKCSGAQRLLGVSSVSSLVCFILLRGENSPFRPRERERETLCARRNTPYY